MGAFQAGFKMGSDIYADVEREKLAKEELAMRKAAEARAQQEFDARMQDRQRESAAFADLESVQRLGLPAVGADGVPTLLRDPTQGAQEFRPGTPLEVNQALQRVAIARKDTRGFQEAAAAGRTMEEDRLLAEAFQAKDDPEEIKWVNLNHKQISIAKPDKHGIARYSTVTPDGDAVFGKLTAKDRGKIRGALRIMQTNPTRALAMLEEVDKNVAAVIAADNKLTLDTGKVNNDAAFHSGSLDNDARRARASEISAQASATSAGAQAALARTHGQLYQEQINDIQQNRAHNTEARQLAAQFDALSPQDQAGPVGQALQRRFNMLNAKPGTTLGLGSGAASKPPLVLDDREKIAYQKALDEIAMLRPDENGQVPANATAMVYRKYGLDPAKFGVETPLDKAIRAKLAGGSAGSALPGAIDLTTKTNKELQALARKPRGVSSAEANAAAEELELRKQGRMTAF